MTDRATILVTDRDGTVHSLPASEGRSLMEVLRDDAGLDIAAACGGSGICATCHIHVAPEWRDRLPPPANDEKELVAQLELAGATSRLACQIRSSAALDGLVLTLAPEE